MPKISIALRKRTLGDGTPWPPFDAETLWAVPLEKGSYKIENIPFFAESVNFGDVVTARPARSGEDTDAILELQEIVGRSGHRTVHVVLLDQEEQSMAERAIDEVEKLGCEWEAGGATIAIDVPPSINLDDVLGALSGPEREKVVAVEVVLST